MRNRCGCQLQLNESSVASVPSMHAHDVFAAGVATLFQLLWRLVAP